MARLCRCGCGADLDALYMRADAVWASRACAMRFKRGQAPANRDVGRTRPRKPVRFAVIEWPNVVSVVEARDHRAAQRHLADGLVAVPARCIEAT